MKKYGFKYRMFESQSNYERCQCQNPAKTKYAANTKYPTNAKYADNTKYPANTKYADKPAAVVLLADLTVQHQSLL